MYSELEKHIGRRIVLDTRSSWVYIGQLEQVTKECVILSDTDVHDSNDSDSTKELYIFDIRSTGVISNREKVYINIDYVVSFSLLEDVKQF